MQKLLKAKRPRSFYKSTDAWLDAVWRNNEERIRAAYEGIKKPKASFKSSMKQYMKQGLSPAEAMSTLVKSTIFTPARERFIDNASKGLRGDKAAYKAFRDLTREKGRFTKFDPSLMRWDKKEKIYIYNNQVIISFKNSPERVEVRPIGGSDGG